MVTNLTKTNALWVNILWIVIVCTERKWKWCSPLRQKNTEPKGVIQNCQVPPTWLWRREQLRYLWIIRWQIHHRHHAAVAVLTLLVARTLGDWWVQAKLIYRSDTTYTDTKQTLLSQHPAHLAWNSILSHLCWDNHVEKIFAPQISAS